MDNVLDMENVIDIEVDVEQAEKGLSAYEVYLQTGGTLSEEEWLESLRGPQGEPGGVKIIHVTELPTEDIDDTAVYVKPSENPHNSNKYDEFIYVNGDWEPFGGNTLYEDVLSIEIDDVYALLTLKGNYPEVTQKDRDGNDKE